MDLAPPGSAAPALLERLRARQSRVGEQKAAFDNSLAGVRAIADAPLPASVEELRVLLDASFFATLLTDENRPTRFACAFLGPDDPRGITVRRLAKPLPFGAESICRIAQAADPELTSLGVWRDDCGWSIWGLLDAPRLVCLQIFGSDPGVLRVTYLRQTQMTYAHGQGRVRTEQDPSFITSIQLIGTALGLVTPQWYRPRALLGLADALVRTGEGGCVLVSTRPRDEVRRGWITLTFPTHSPITTLEEPVLETQEANPPASPDAELFQHFKSAERQNNIRRTARLAAVDGAVLVDSHLRIAGFGAMIDVRGMRGSGRVFRVDLPGAMADVAEPSRDLSMITARAETSLDEFGGQRHQSAIRWCSTSRRALLALVCSQDGAASLIAPLGTGGDVGVVRNIETSPENW